MADLRARQRMMDELYGLRAKVTEAVNNLREAREMIETAETMLESDKMEQNDERVERLTERSDAVKDSVNALFDFVFGEEIEKQGITSRPEPTIADRLEDPEFYISSGLGGPGATERTLMRKARQAAGQALDRINDFFATEWPAYVQEVEAAELSPFKKFKSVELDSSSQ